MRFEQLAFRAIDLASMEQKCKAVKYKSLEQFYNDARIILHNVFLCYGGQSPSITFLEIVNLKVCCAFCFRTQWVSLTISV